MRLVKVGATVSRSRRRAREYAAKGSFATADIRAILKAQRHRCAYCKKSIKKNYVMDHVVPLARGGTNDRKNMQATCAPCNLRKHARDPLDFARSLGMLL
jgi:5-methylcytosine-specific restriction endonuclease McrA